MSQPIHAQLPDKTGNYCITLADGIRLDAFYDAVDYHWYHPEKDMIIGHGLVVNDFFIVHIE